MLIVFSRRNQTVWVNYVSVDVSKADFSLWGPFGRRGAFPTVQDYHCNTYAHRSVETAGKSPIIRPKTDCRLVASTTMIIGK